MMIFPNMLMSKINNWIKLYFVFKIYFQKINFFFEKKIKEKRRLINEISIKHDEKNDRFKIL